MIGKKLGRWIGAAVLVLCVAAAGCASHYGHGYRHFCSSCRTYYACNQHGGYAGHGGYADCGFAHQGCGHQQANCGGQQHSSCSYHQYKPCNCK